MRSIALTICAFALVACSQESTGQSRIAISEGENTPGQPGDAGGGGASGGDGAVLGGCTYTQGFWKNHPSAWPVTSLTIGGVSYSEQQLLALFNTAPMGDASLILGHQLIAALLNVDNGAVPSTSVAQAINSAQAWMAANQSGDSGLPFGVSAGSTAGQQATALTQTLDDFNSGLAGTPHCGSGSTNSGTGSATGTGTGGETGNTTGSSTGGETGSTTGGTTGGETGGATGSGTAGIPR